ncbi:MAG: hypothetical protein HY913_13840 [Desulfomonile tiedjei]|nr:hypothetical protein [Desulfomonile tiedjei]
MGAATFELGFAKFIERFREQIKEAFLEDAVKREILSQHGFGHEMLSDLADSILAGFTKNIDKKTSVETLAEKYSQLGTRCSADRVSQSEVVHAFILLKRHIWLFFQDNNFAGQPFDVRSIIALNNRTALFFDRAVYYFLVGYEGAASPEAPELEALYRDFLAKIRRDLGMPPAE